MPTTPSMPSSTALDDVLLLFHAALDSTDAAVYEEKHESMVRGAARVLLALDVTPGRVGTEKKALLPLLVGLIRHDLPDDALFEPLFARFGASLFDGPGGPEATARAAIDRCLDGAGSKRASWDKRELDTCMTWLLRHAPQAALTAWDQPGDTAGAGLVGRLLRVSWGWKALRVLGERGVAWTAAARVGEPLAARLRQPEQWSAFLAQGGDPQLPVPDALAQTSRPVWQHLLRTKETDDAMKAALQRWLEEQPHPSEDVRTALREFSYWTGFAKAPANRDGMLSHLFSVTDWAAARDAQGVPAWVHAVSMIPSSMTPLLREPAHREALAQRDGHGRSPWFHLLPLVGERHLPSFDDIRRGLSSLPDATSDQAGRGLLFSLAEAELEPVRLKPRLMALFGRREHPSAITQHTPSSLNTTHISRLTAEDWARGTVEQHNALARRLLAVAKPEKLESLVRLVLRRPDVQELLSPRLKGAILLIALRCNPFSCLAPDGEGKSQRDLQRGPPLQEVPPLSWLYRGGAVFPEDAVPRLQAAMKDWGTANRSRQWAGSSFQETEFQALLDERSTVMERVLLGQVLEADMVPAAGTARRARM